MGIPHWERSAFGKRLKLHLEGGLGQEKQEDRRRRGWQINVVCPPLSITVSTAKLGQATSPRSWKEELLWETVKDQPSDGVDLIFTRNRIDSRFPPEAGWKKIMVYRNF